MQTSSRVNSPFSGDIHTLRQHWTNGKSSECIGKGCSTCAIDPENFPAFRFRINFITARGDQWIPKIFEGGGKIYDALVSLDKKFNLSRTVVDITRRGTKQNTAYDILPRLDRQLSSSEEGQVKAVPLLKLSASDAGNAPKVDLA